MKNEKVIPIGMISDDNFIMPTSVAIISMIQNKSEDTYYEIYILMAECSDASKEKMNSLNTLCEKVSIHLIDAGLERYKKIKQLAHISIACLLKFDICDMIPYYDKLLYLDGDIIVRGDLWELYNIELDGKYAAGVKEIQCIDTNCDNINAGIVLFNAKRIREERLSEKLYAMRIQLGDRPSMDQQTFNIVTGKEYKFISIKYNCILSYLIPKESGLNFSIDKINSLYNEKYKNKQKLIDEALIYHFATGNKPWKYTLNSGAKEWYNYYRQSPCYDASFKMYGKWKYRYSKFVEAWKKNGIKGILLRVEDKIKRTLNVRDKQDNWE